MHEYVYGGYVGTLARRVEGVLAEIHAHQNLELGDEFEIALCKVLRKALPQKYGVCRGYVVDMAGAAAGDDIVIYDRARFTSLRVLGDETYDSLERVPIEAAYAYIEAKHTLNLNGEDESSLSRAKHQAARVRELCATRAPMEIGMFTPYDKAVVGIPHVPRGFHTIRNPFFTAIFARRVREKKGAEVLVDPEHIDRISHAIPYGLGEPDLIILGEHNLIAPAMPPAGEDPRVARNGYLASPFYVEGQSIKCTSRVDGLAYGVGLAWLLYALDVIQLGAMNWTRIIGNALGFDTPKVGPQQEPVLVNSPRPDSIGQ
jgi:hypothetical protein